MGGVFSLKFMVSSNLQQGTAVFILFQGKWALFSDLGLQASKTDRLILDSYRKNASLILHWAMTAGAEEGGLEWNGGRGLSTLAWVGVMLHLHYSKCFAVGGPLPFIFCGIQRRAAKRTSAGEAWRRKVEQHPSLCKWNWELWRIRTNLN